MGKEELASIIGGVWIPLLILAGSVVFRAAAMYFAAREAHKTKMLELAVTTANSEFGVSQNLLEKSGLKPRPMSSYVIFHFFLFKKLEDIKKGYSVDAALQETFEEVNKIFAVYARSGITDYGRVWNIDPPQPNPTPTPGA